MLTRSPVPPRSSANASPSLYGHYAYAIADSPLLSPSRSIAASLSRRPSASSSSSSSHQPRPSKRYVNASTQWSPPTSQAPLPASVAPSSDGSRASSSARELPPTPPGPRAMTPGIEQGAGQTEPPRARPSIISATNYNQINSTSSDLATGSMSRSAPLAGGDHSTGTAAAGADRQPPPASGPATTKKRSEPTRPDRESSPAAEQSSSPKRPRAASRPLRVLPQRYEACPVSDMVVLIANMIGELIETNDPLQRAGGHLTRFHSRTAPGISVVEYLRRLAKHATVPTPLLLVVVYYMDRLCAVYKEFTINTLTVHRFLITAVTVASKGLSDAFWNNTTYARVGGLKVAELRLLELEFLYRMDWKIIPKPENLEQYYSGLVQRHPGYCFHDSTAQDGARQPQRREGDDYNDPTEEDTGESSSRSNGKQPERPQATTQSPSETQDEEDGDDNDDEEEDDDDEMAEEASEG